MKNYIIYFEVYGKKMKTTVFAGSEESAKDIVRSKVVFHKVVKKPDVFNEVSDLMDFFKKK